MKLFGKAYSGEELVDVERDIIESFDPRFNLLAKVIPQDEHGFPEGSFTVTIEWSRE
jgi:hypothetical protein